MPTLRHCIKCSEHIVVGDRFCAHCGAEQPSTLGAEGSEKGVSRWDDIENRLQEATEGRYHIRGLIGRGGMAAVYLADWPNMDLRIAIKVMDPYLLDQETFVQRFLQEARTIARLRHRHIIRVYDSGQAGDLFYFCMDYYPGRSMEQVLEAEGPIPVEVVKLWLHQAADALGYAHRQPSPVVHRDVKPSNMLLDKEGEVVLTDFGIAKVRDVGQTMRSPSLTMPGSVLGTPTYISPEQAAVILNSGDAPKSSQASGASDQYSLGVVGYEMLCGEPPFSGDLAPLCVAHAEREPPSILAKRPDCPPDLAQNVLRMLEKNPKDRWPNMEAICTALAVRTPTSGSPLRTQMVSLVRGHKPVASVSLSPPSGEFFVGQSLSLNGTPLGLDGRPLPDRPLSWRSSDPQIALVTDEGVVKALRPGPVAITATSEGISGEIRLAVSPIRVDTVVVLPSEIAIPVGGSQTLRTLLLSREGEELTDREISWTSNDPQVASVDASGTVQTHKKGTTAVIASSEGRMGRATISVIPVPVASVEVSPGNPTVEVGQTGVIACVPRDSGGNPLQDRTIEWTVDDPSVIEVLGDGTIRGAAPGRAVISATVDGVVGTAEIKVSPERAVSVQLSPGQGGMVEGGTLKLTAVPFSAKGKDVTGRPVHWTSSDSSVVQVDGEGGIVAGIAGTARVTVTCDDASASASITVTPAPVVGLDLFPSSLSLSPGETARLSATPRGDSGQTLGGREISWSTSDSTIAQISEQGWITAVSEGEAIVTATSGGQSASAEVSVEPAPVAEIEFSQDVLSLEVGESHALTAVFLSKDGTPLEDRTGDWDTSAPELVQVNSAGRVEALAEGTAELYLSSEGLTRTVKVTVVPASVGAVKIAPASLELPEGESSRFSVSLSAKDGRPIEGRAIAWSSDRADVAQVDQVGVVSAVSSGKTTITARCEGATAAAEVRVVTEPVAALSVDPKDVEVGAGESVTLRWEARSESGAVLSVRSMEWSSSDTDVVEVSPEGRLSGRGPGSAVVHGSCEGQSVSVSVSVRPETVESVGIQSPKTTLEIGETMVLGCQVVGASGQGLSDRQVTWLSNAPSIAEVDSGGRVAARAPGQVTIQASSEGREGTLVLTVAPPAVASVVVEPEEVSILPGETLQLNAEVTDVAGQAAPDRPVTWTSSEERIVQVDGDGRAVAVAPGRATLAVSCGGVSTQIPVEIRTLPVESIEIKPNKTHLRPKKTDQATVVVRGRDGTALEGRKIQWESSDSSVAEVGSTGRIKGLKPGTAKITANCEDVSDSYLLTIEAGGGLPGWAPWGLGALAVVVIGGFGLSQLFGPAGPESGTPVPSVASVALTPGDSLFLTPGGTLDLGITALDDGGARVQPGDLPQPRWEVSDNSISSVSRAGVLTGINPGTALVSASLDVPGGGGTLVATGTVVVVEAAANQVAQVEVEGPGDLVEGDQTQLLALVLDSSGVEVQGGLVEWSSSDQRVATVSGSGISGTVRALRPGSVSITATVEGVSNTHRLIVEAQPIEGTPDPDPPPVDPGPTTTSVRVSPAQSELQEGATLQLRLLDQNGDPVAGAFRVDNQSVATVSGQGVLNAVGAGSVRVTGTYEGLAATGTFQVVAAPVLEPDPAVLDSIRTTVQEARERAGTSEFPAAYELLDQSGARMDALRTQFPEAPSLGELYDWFITEYRATKRDCDLYVEALTGTGIELPTCKQAPGGGSGS